MVLENPGTWHAVAPIGATLMHTVTTVLIVLTAGFTVSAIVANIYRIAGFTSETTSGHVLRLAVLMIAGPSEIFESAIEARINGQWSALGFWLVITAVGYWSLIIGDIVVSALMRLVT
jgi:hypothetical protein